MNRLIEIRSYKLTPGGAHAFHAAFASTAVPMVRAFGIDVVAFGPSPHEPDAYFLVRSFRNLADRQLREDAFYSSQEWLRGPREGILTLIETYLDTVLWLPDQSVEHLRSANAPVDAA